MRKSCRGTIITLRTEVYLTGKEDSPALVLSNVHNRISVTDVPLFGSIGLSMYTITTSLVMYGTLNNGVAYPDLIDSLPFCLIQSLVPEQIDGI
jgi:hypothetical protein